MMIEMIVMPSGRVRVVRFSKCNLLTAILSWKEPVLPPLYIVVHSTIGKKHDTDDFLNAAPAHPVSLQMTLRSLFKHVSGKENASNGGCYGALGRIRLRVVA